MKTICISLNDDLAEQLLAFLKKVGGSEKEVYIQQKPREEHTSDLVDFFRSSPLVGELQIERNDEKYKERITF